MRTKQFHFSEKHRELAAVDADIKELEERLKAALKTKQKKSDLPPLPTKKASDEGKSKDTKEKQETRKTSGGDKAATTAVKKTSGGDKAAPAKKTSEGDRAESASKHDSPKSGKKKSDRKNRFTIFKKKLGFDEKEKEKDTNLTFTIVPGTFKHNRHVGLDSQLQDLEEIFTLISKEAGIPTDSNQNTIFKKGTLEREIPKHVESLLIDRLSSAVNGKALDVSACDLTFLPDFIYRKYSNIV